MINNKFTTEFKNKRMVWYEEEAELAENIDFKGHIQQTSAELTQSLGLTFTKTYTIWCPIWADVVEGDELESGGNIYIVKAIKDLLVGMNKHKQLFVEKKENYG